MGFQALFERENVFDILCATLISYYRERGIDNIQVVYSEKANADEFLIVPRIGMIAQAYPSKVIRKHYYNAYNVRGNIIKNFAAKIYVFLAAHTKSLVSMRKRIYISPKNVINPNTVFSICNRSIRVFDFEKNSTVSIQKKGFTDKFFTNQLEFRTTHDYDFIPKIINHGTTWFEEPLLTGHMLARETDEIRFKQSMEQAVRDINCLAQDTLVMVDATEYVKGLSCTLNTLLQKTKENKSIRTLSTTEKIVDEICSHLQQIEGNIPTAVTHGDLQAGNVWVDDNEKIWVLDWETQGRRSVWFDATTLEFSTRYYGGIKKLVNSVDMGNKIKSKLCSVSNCDLPIIDMVLIYLAEDLIFYFEDMLELPNNGGCVSFDRYINELNEIEWAKLYRRFESLNGK